MDEIHFEEVFSRSERSRTQETVVVAGMKCKEGATSVGKKSTEGLLLCCA